MNYPLITEYIEAIKSAEDNLNELSYLSPILDKNGQPVMSGGNFAVVFKMKDNRDGKLHAVKCFTKEQEGRSEAYRQIAEELKEISSSYLTSFHYYDNELFVDSRQTTNTVFPVLLMDWVNGVTLDEFVNNNKNTKTLWTLTDNFFNLSEWLISHPFAHGDLKPDNILVREDASIIIVDYDGMFVSAMKGQKARELGSPDFRHPLRTENDFDEHIDDVSILSLLLSLCTLSAKMALCNTRNRNYDIVYFCEQDYRDILNSPQISSIPPLVTKSTNYLDLLAKVCQNKSFCLKKGSLIPVKNLFAKIEKFESDLQKIITGARNKPIYIPNSDFNQSVESGKESVQTIINDGNNTLGGSWTIDNEPPKQPRKTNDTISAKKSIANYLISKDSTRWQTALLLHVITIFTAYLSYRCNDNNNQEEMWIYIGWGLGIGIIAWFFSLFDYVKRNGSFGNCLLALILFPVTIYYAFYRFLLAILINLKTGEDTL